MKQWLKKEDVKEGAFVDLDYRPESFLQVKNIQPIPGGNGNVMFDLYEWDGTPIPGVHQRSSTMKSLRILSLDEVKGKITLMLERGGHLIKEHQDKIAKLETRSAALLKKCDEAEEYFKEKGKRKSAL